MNANEISGIRRSKPILCPLDETKEQEVGAQENNNNLWRISQLEHSLAKYGWAFSNDMPDRYIQRKGIMSSEIAEKGDTDQTRKLQKENRQIMEKMEILQREYNKVRKAFRFIMPVIEEMDEDLKRRIFERRKKKSSQLRITLTTDKRCNINFVRQRHYFCKVIKRIRF
jgi:hypothetical protein